METLFIACKFIFAGALWSMITKKVTYITCATLVAIIVVSLNTIRG